MMGGLTRTAGAFSCGLEGAAPPPVDSAVVEEAGARAGPSVAAAPSATVNVVAEASSGSPSIAPEGALPTPLPLPTLAPPPSRRLWLALQFRKKLTKAFCVPSCED